MVRTYTPALSAALVLAAACGGSEPAQDTTPVGQSRAITDEPAEDTAAAPAEEAAPAEDTAAAAEPAAGDDASAAGGDAAPGAPAPAFTLPDLDGNEVSLSDFSGKTVVLEWFNPKCPFIQYAHNEGPLATMPGETGDDVVWLAINSNAAGKQGNGVELNREMAKELGVSYPVLIDDSGEVGQSYGATSTPHMFVIDPDGNLAYGGALDNAPLGKVRGDEQVNYVERALAAVAAGEPVEPAETKSYGCSVKYAN